jgi:small-conductance mechanosensitive channel
MSFDFTTIKNWLAPILFILGGLVLGIVCERVVLRKLRRFAAQTRWESDEIITNALRGMPVVWLLVAGFYGALVSVPVREDVARAVKTTLLVLLILSASVVAARLAAGFVALSSRKAGVAFLSTSIFVNLTKIVVFAVGILTVLQTLGIPITPLFTALGIGGLAVALGLQETLSNLFAGIQVIASKQIRPGDYVKLASGEEGYISDITWRYTTIRSLPNNRIIVPNAKISSAIVTNHHLPDREMAVLVNVGVSYQSDLDEVERATIEVAREVMEEVQGGVPEFAPFIRFHTFGDFSINFTVILRAREFVDQYLIKHEFVKRLHRRYRGDGIEIPFPIRTVYVKGG